MPGQAYCSHPPHCTLLFGNFGSPADWLQTLRKSVATLDAFELETDSWQQFPGDPLAGGGHTVAYRAHRSPALGSLQQTVADCVAPFKVTASAPHPLTGTEPFATSLRKFGSPFVGSHWIPHFTIGSPMVSAMDPLLAQLMSGSSCHRFTVRALSVWHVEGDRHERLQVLALGKA